MTHIVNISKEIQVNTISIRLDISVCLLFGKFVLAFELFSLLYNSSVVDIVNVTIVILIISRFGFAFHSKTVLVDRFN